MFNIILCMDENNLDGLFATINSIVQNALEMKNIKFNILVYDNIEYVSDKLNKCFGTDFDVELKQFIDYPEYENFLKLNINVVNSDKKFKYITNMMNFSRFYVPLIFDKINIGLYLDTDVIVQTDITKIFDGIDESVKIASPLNKPLSIMEIDKQFNMKGYGFNTGVYILNFCYWRNNNLTKECEKLMIKHKTTPLFKLGTQPIINILFYEQCKNIDKKWNRTGLGSDEYSIEKLKAQYILHWTGPKKPWFHDGLNKAIWEKYKI